MNPVIIAGAGPVGLALAVALARREVPVVLLDENDGSEERRLARTVILRPDTVAFLERLGCGDAFATGGCRWTAWRTVRRHQPPRRLVLDDGPTPAIPHARSAVPAPAGRRPDHNPLAGEHPGSAGRPATAQPEPGHSGLGSPLHLPQHRLTRALRDALAPYTEDGLVRHLQTARLDALEQDERGVTGHTGGSTGTWLRGSYLVGCDGARSTVRKLLKVRFPGRTAIERHAVAALRTRLPWPGEATLHRAPPWRGADQEVTARPLAGGVWRLDWLLPVGRELVTPEDLLGRVRATLAGWCAEPPPFELLDTGVYTVHHRLALRWRVRRAFLAGDAAHLMGALGTQGLDEGLRDVANLAWKLELAWQRGPTDTLLDSYQAERRGAVSARLRAADQALPSVRGPGPWRAARRTVVPGTARQHDALVTGGHVGHGVLGESLGYERSPLAPRPAPPSAVPVGTPLGAPVANTPVTGTDGTVCALHDRLGGAFLVVLVAPGTGVWERRHWMGAGLMPKLAEAVAALPVPAEVLVTEGYPGAAAHTVLLVRPDGHLVMAFAGVRPAEMYACVRSAAQQQETSSGEPTGGSDKRTAGSGSGRRGHAGARARRGGPARAAGSPATGDR